MIDLVLAYVCIGVVCFAADVLVSRPWEEIPIDLTWYLNGLITLVTWFLAWPVILVMTILKGGRP